MGEQLNGKGVLAVKITCEAGKWPLKESFTELPKSGIWSPGGTDGRKGSSIALVMSIEAIEDSWGDMEALQEVMPYFYCLST